MMTALSPGASVPAEERRTGASGLVGAGHAAQASQVSWGTSAKGGLLPGDHDDPGIAGPPLDRDRLDGWALTVARPGGRRAAAGHAARSAG